MGRLGVLGRGKLRLHFGFDPAGVDGKAACGGEGRVLHHGAVKG